MNAKSAVMLAKKKHMHFRVVGSGGMISTPVVRNEWLYLPVAGPNIIIPPNALARLHLLKNAGFKMQGLIVAHEAPKLLAAPLAPPAPPVAEPDVKVKSLDLAEVVLTLLGILGRMFLAGLLIDPALIVVLEDGTWVEVMRWYE